MVTEEVVDASYILSLLLPDEGAHDNVPDKMVAPMLLKSEVINGLRSAVISKRISVEIANKLLAEFESWTIRYVEVNTLEVFELSVNHKLSGYDASYVWVAKKLRLPLRTFDKKMMVLL